MTKHIHVLNLDFYTSLRGNPLAGSFNQKEKNLIQIYDDVINDSKCVEIEKMFESDNEKKLGITPTGVHVNVKNSIDLYLGDQLPAE